MTLSSAICNQWPGPGGAQARPGPGFWLPFALLLLFPCAAGAMAPAWAGTAATTGQAYLFTTAATQPEPEVVDNGYGIPDALVQVTTPFGTGWQDPNAQFTTPGVNADGAWDVGPSGSITFSLPVAPALTDPGLYYRMDLYAYVVAYEALVALPVISAPGLVLGNVASSTAIVKNEILGRYKSITWTAEADVGGAGTLDLVVAATAQGAVIDSVEIHTRFTLMGVPQHVFSAWTSANFPGGTDPLVIGFDAMPDGDGISNGMKYYLGMGRTADRPVLAAVGAGPSTLVFTHTRNKTGAPDVAAAYEWSTDLLDWHADGAAAGATTVSFVREVTDTSDSDFDVLTVTASISGPVPPRLFTRLLVSQQNL